MNIMHRVRRLKPKRENIITGQSHTTTMCCIMCVDHETTVTRVRDDPTFGEKR